MLNKITAYGTPGIIAAGAAAVWGQSMLQWVTQPSHMLPVAAITAVSAITVAKRKGKAKTEQAPAAAVESIDERIRRLTEAMEQAPQALPRSTQVIDYTAAGQEVTRASKRLV